MKKLLLCTVLLFVPVCWYAQTNLVPNASFEDTINCPYQAGDIDKASGWTSFCGSPDFYYACNQYDWGVPNNLAGYQNPASGNAYTGFATYSNSAPNAREFPTCTLANPLTIGTKYFVSFKVALALTNFMQLNTATNKIGAMFTTGLYPCIITNNPPIFSDSIITDSLNWTRITGSFIADSAYSYLSIGNFFDDANTDTVKFLNDFSDNAYYYLDDVCLGTDSAFVYGYDWVTGISQNSANPILNFYPNPVKDYLFVQTYLNEVINVSIYNLLGEQLLNIKEAPSKTFSIDLSSIPSGMLIINFETSNQSSSYKLQKL